MKQFILLVLISAVLNPISICAQFVEWDFSPGLSDSMFKFSPPENPERVDFF